MKDTFLLALAKWLQISQLSFCKKPDRREFKLLLLAGVGALF